MLPQSAMYMLSWSFTWSAVKAAVVHAAVCGGWAAGE